MHILLLLYIIYVWCNIFFFVFRCTKKFHIHCCDPKPLSKKFRNEIHIQFPYYYHFQSSSPSLFITSHEKSLEDIQEEYTCVACVRCDGAHQAHCV